MLSKNAFNALLKTLEEPPENVVFIFATTEPQKVLATIISRCQRYDFKRIPIEAIVERLKDICAVENIRIDSESLYLIARKADGGMRDALSLMDQAISYCVNDITIDKVRQIFGLIPNQVFQRFFQLIDAKDAPALIRELHLVFEQGTDLQEFLVNLLEFIRVLILRKLGVQTQDINPDELAAFDELGTLFSQNKLLYILSMLIASRADLKSSSNPYLLLEALMIKLCKLDEMEDLAAMINNLGTAGPIANPSNIVRPNPSLSRPLPASVVPPEPPMQSREEPEHIKQDFNEENLATLWPRILVRTKKISNMCSLALDSSKQRAVQGKHLSLSLESQTNYNLLKSNLDKLHEIFSELFHNKVQISLKLLEVEPPTKVHIRRRTLEDLKQESPEVARFAELTDAILVPSP
ncbi:MAG TPA: DNA polymerase III subunit gamma/tau, partial [Candidatus Cloacimonas sp.]|nr:DNA polymerase III subunit gamma/tau [Candidatus Cloacimonas sp.]